MKKHRIYALILAAVLTSLAGCGQSQDSIPNTTGQTVTELATTNRTEAELPTEKESSKPPTTAPAVTEATEPVTEPTEPKTDPVEPEATEPASTTPTAPTTPTEPKPTTPVQTEPAQHSHQYTAKVVKPTCAKGGYTVHTCSCGDSYTDSKTPPGEHSYNKGTVKPTMWQEGYTIYTCTVCKDSYKDDYVNISEDDRQAFVDDVRAATAKYLNQYRKDQGSPSAPILPGLTKVANYRAKQLRTNFAHSAADLREAAAYYQYGKYVAPEGWDPSEYYYSFPAREAIGRGNWVGDADEIGQKIAKAIRNSSGHWAYVGSADYSYMAVGVCYNASAIGGSHWTVCVFVTDTNEYG